MNIPSITGMPSLNGGAGGSGSVGSCVARLRDSTFLSETERLEHGICTELNAISNLLMRYSDLIPSSAQEAFNNIKEHLRSLFDTSADLNSLKMADNTPLYLCKLLFPILSKTDCLRREVDFADNELKRSFIAYVKNTEESVSAVLPKVFTHLRILNYAVVVLLIDRVEVTDLERKNELIRIKNNHPMKPVGVISDDRICSNLSSAAVGATQSLLVREWPIFSRLPDSAPPPEQVAHVIDMVYQLVNMVYELQYGFYSLYSSQSPSGQVAEFTFSDRTITKWPDAQRLLESGVVDQNHPVNVVMVFFQRLARNKFELFLNMKAALDGRRLRNINSDVISMLSDSRSPLFFWIQVFGQTPQLNIEHVYYPVIQRFSEWLKTEEWTGLNPFIQLKFQVINFAKMVLERFNYDFERLSQNITLIEPAFPDVPEKIFVLKVLEKCCDTKSILLEHRGKPFNCLLFLKMGQDIAHGLFNIILKPALQAAGLNKLSNLNLQNVYDCIDIVARNLSFDISFITFYRELRDMPFVTDDSAASSSGVLSAAASSSSVPAVAPAVAAASSSAVAAAASSSSVPAVAPAVAAAPSSAVAAAASSSSVPAVAPAVAAASSSAVAAAASSSSVPAEPSSATFMSKCIRISLGKLVVLFKIGAIDSFKFDKQLFREEDYEVLSPFLDQLEAKKRELLERSDKLNSIIENLITQLNETVSIDLRQFRHSLSNLLVLLDAEPILRSHYDR